jgi:hypothetical protein
MLRRQVECYRKSVISELADHGILLRRWDELTEVQREEAGEYFDSNVSAGCQGISELGGAKPGDRTRHDAAGDQSRASVPVSFQSLHVADLPPEGSRADRADRGANESSCRGEAVDTADCGAGAGAAAADPAARARARQHRKAVYRNGHLGNNAGAHHARRGSGPGRRPIGGNSRPGPGTGPAAAL